MKTIQTTDFGERFSQYKLEPNERRQYYYEYWVTGHGEFPFDMLRHDCCWPYTGTDSSKLFWGHEDRLKTRSIKFCSYREPTIDRWASFGWSVGERAVVLD